MSLDWIPAATPPPFPTTSRELWLVNNGEVVMGGYQLSRFVNTSGHSLGLKTITHWRVRDSIQSKRLVEVFNRLQKEARSG